MAQLTDSDDEMLLKTYIKHTVQSPFKIKYTDNEGFDKDVSKVFIVANFSFQTRLRLTNLCFPDKRVFWSKRRGISNPWDPISSLHAVVERETFIEENFSPQVQCTETKEKIHSQFTETERKTHPILRAIY